MAELISTLADVKIELADVQDALRERDQKIVDLEASLSRKETTTFDGKIFWVEGDNVPYCTVCIEKDSKYYHLTYFEKTELQSEKWFCNVCENHYYVK